jgi:hypothetical protein
MYNIADLLLLSEAVVVADSETRHQENLRYLEIVIQREADWIGGSYMDPFVEEILE